MYVGGKIAGEARGFHLTSEASTIFQDPLSATVADPDHSLGEQRWVTFGFSDAGRLLVVAHTDRDDHIRITSARLVTKAERKIYEKTQ